MGCPFGRQSHEFAIVEIALAGGHSLIDMQFAILGMQTADRGSKLVEHLLQLLTSSRLAGIQQCSHPRRRHFLQE